jgi:hypothetical protein
VKRNINPIEFAAAIRAAQSYRVNGASQIAEATHACRQQGISDDWAAPLLAFLNDSPSTAEAWADRMYNEALDRAYQRSEGASS